MRYGQKMCHCSYGYLQYWHFAYCPSCSHRGGIGLLVLPTLTAALPGQSWGVPVTGLKSTDSTTTNFWWNKRVELILSHVVTCSCTLNPGSSALSNDKRLLSHESMPRRKMWLGELVVAYQSACSIHFSVLRLVKHENNQILAAFAFDVHPDQLTE